MRLARGVSTLQNARGQSVKVAAVVRTALVLSLGLLVAVSAAWGAGKRRNASDFAGQTAQAGPSLRVTAVIHPQMTVELGTDQVNFDVTGSPGGYDASSPVTVTVGSNCVEWTVHARATDLVGMAGSALENGSVIPRSRVLIRSNGSGVATLDFQPLDVDVVVATGGQQGPALVATTDFRLLTEWSDPPGQYQGEVNFTYIAKF
jgi:hypothetical protein